MARRDDLDRGFDDWLHLLGRRLKAARKARGWTQPEAADHCAIQFKQYQDYEDARRPASLQTLYRLARGLGLLPDDVLDLAPSPDAENESLPEPLAALLARGWRRPPRSRESNTIPVYDLLAAAGPQGQEREPAVIARLRPPARRRLTATEGLFLAQVQGESMAPAIRDGAWCLFRQPVVPPLVGKVVLLRHSATGTGEVGAYQLKRMGGERQGDDGLHLTLLSNNPAFAPQNLRVASEADVQVLGEWLEVTA
jgi:transcriptional regulator with XRE-family HTH domain